MQTQTERYESYVKFCEAVGVQPLPELQWLVYGGINLHNDSIRRAENDKMKDMQVRNRRGK